MFNEKRGFVGFGMLQKAKANQSKTQPIYHHRGGHANSIQISTNTDKKDNFPHSESLTTAASDSNMFFPLLHSLLTSKQKNNANVATSTKVHEHLDTSHNALIFTSHFQRLQLYWFICLCIISHTHKIPFLLGSGGYVGVIHLILFWKAELHLSTFMPLHALLHPWWHSSWKDFFLKLVTPLYFWGVNIFSGVSSLIMPWPYQKKICQRY